MKVIGIGDNVCDKYIHLKTMFPGGQALNFAVYAKMLGHSASYMGVFGRDEVADHIIKTLDEIGVEHARCRQYDGENGYAMVNLADGDRVFMGSNKGGIVNEHPIQVDEDDLEYLKQFDVIYTSNNGHFIEQLKDIEPLHVPVSFDFSNKWMDGKLAEQVTPYITFAFASCGDISEEEAKEVCKRLRKGSVQVVAATRGSKGAVLFDGNQFWIQPAHFVQPVDTLGAGDSFATAFLLHYAEYVMGKELNASAYEEEVTKALDKAAEFSAKTCLVQGAFGHGKRFEHR